MRNKLPKQQVITFPLESVKADLELQLKLGRKVISLVPHYEAVFAHPGTPASIKLTGYMAVVQLSKEERTRVVH